MEFLGFLATPLGYVMQFLYNLVLNYGWALIIFTVLIRLAMFPISLRQQKSTARNAAYQPMIQEIQKKWANDRNKQNEEVMKFQQENGIKMTAGCAPMLINFVVLFSVIAVIYRPLTYILHVPADVLESAIGILGVNANDYTAQSRVIGQVLAGNSEIMGALGASWSETIANFNFQFMGLNMAQTPTFSLEMWPYLVLPVLSILTMFLSQIIVMRTSGQQQGKGTMLVMTVVMGVIFGTYAFRVPVAFSLYYTVSNVLMLVQQLISKRIYDPEKIKEQALAEIEERKKLKKAKKVVKVADESGNVVAKELSDADLAKLRLAKARELDAERYTENDEDSNKARQAAEKARMADEEKYGDNDEKTAEKSLTAEPADVDEAKQGEAEGDETVQETEAAADAAPKAEYKPGRRKRAKQNKEKPVEEASSFADKEQQKEKGDNRDA